MSKSSKKTRGVRNQRWKRRDFLRSSVTAALVAPVAHFWTDIAEAQDIANAKRACLIFLPNAKGTNDSIATGTGSNYQFVDGFEPLNPYKADTIAISKYAMQPLLDMAASHRASQGVSTLGDGHIPASQAAFTAGIPFSSSRDGATSPSIDQLIAEHNVREGLVADRRLANMVIQIDGSHWNMGGGSRSVFRAADASVNYNQASVSQTADAPMVKSPVEGWNVLFGDLMQMEPGETAVTLWAQGKSALDGTHQEIARVRDQLPQSGRHILEQHMQSLRELETSLQARIDAQGQGGTFTIPDRPQELTTNPSNHVQVLEQWFSLIDAAFRSDRMRVFAMQFGGSASRFQVPELSKGSVGPGDSNSGTDHHSYTHHAEGQVKDFIRWYAERLASFVGKLKGGAEREDLLQSSVVMSTMEHGHGSAHRATDVPTLLFGNARGYFKTGQHIEGSNGDPRIPTGTLLAVCHAMGATEIQQVGYPLPDFHNGVWAPLRA